MRSDDLIFLSYEFLSAFLPFLLFCFLFLHRLRKRNRSLTAHSRFFVLVFAVYIIGVYHFTGAGTLYEGLRFLPSFHPSYNLIPFSHHIDPAGYVLNAVLFLPLGFLVPLLWDKADRFLSVLGVGAAFSVFIELTQLLNVRASDVDDLILNAAGTVLGFAAYRIFDKAAGSRFQQRNVPLSLLAASILVPYLGRFLLYDDMGLARLLYGF